MAKLTHKNLHASGDKTAVYQSLQKDYDRDTWVQGFWHIVFWACAIGASMTDGHRDWLWLFGGMYAIERAITKYIDNSNRNWTMHVFDWMETRSEGDQN